ncbi:membrane assembly protein AsmA [Pseudoroseomonas deserti]|uniref:Membrane assembly protein AsmA n=1 Tax=Teichococcus deserti TaxID=1817963 RepID=A0A1V2H1C6_9PROT|nr:AsmA family protein [Pseudoroseomonas deserti]ONG52745.1 membrane assembly protein AsmA [Pseudoroseomonas deserti]
MALRRILIWTGIPVLAVVLLIAFWSWTWFIPLAERQASARLGRAVTIADLDVDLGRVTEIRLGGVRIANPEGFPEEPPFAAVQQLAVRLDVMEFIRHRRIVIPDIALTQPALRLIQNPDGKNNYSFPALAGDPDAPPTPPEEQPQIGALRIQEGRAQVSLAQLQSEMQLAIATEEPEGQPARIRVTAEGTYARQPITGELTGGAVLSLRNAEDPWPIKLDLANGPTRVALEGTLSDPLRFAGANIRLRLEGPDMARLTPLTGVPIPPTPAYRIAGRLDYADRAIRFTGMEGTVGRSDLNGDIAVTPRADTRPLVEATLRSRRVDLDDLGGFIGAKPGEAPDRRQAARNRVLPDTPVNLPKLEAADIRLTYDGGSILGSAMPLDDLHAKLDITDGAIALRPLRFGVGRGRIEGNFDFAPQQGGGLSAKGDVRFQRVDLSRLMGVTPLGEGQGAIGGAARIDTRGRSIAEMLGQGDGAVTLGMAGGNLSSLLVDLSGLQLGNAILSALGLPSRTKVECFIADLGLRRGVLNTRTVLIDTDSSLISGTGTIDLRRERLDYALRTEAKHFTIGALTTNIEIDGSFRDPSVRPEMLELGARAGAAVGLGIIALPLAILPTVRFGIGEDNRCEGLVRRAR